MNAAEDALDDGQVAVALPPAALAPPGEAALPGPAPAAPPEVDEPTEALAAPPVPDGPANAPAAVPPMDDDGNDLSGVILADMAAARGTAAVSFLEDFAEVDEPEVNEPEVDEPEDPQQKAQPSIATRVAGDITGGIGEAGTQVIGGVRDAYVAAAEGVASFDQWASEKLNLPKLQLMDADGNLDVRVLSAEDAGKAKVFMPDVREPDTVTGGLVRGISQFLTGYLTGSKLLGSVGGVSALANVGRSAGASVMSDFAAFDGHEQRLSDLIESVPALSNPVTGYLQSDQSDGELEGRLKNVAEGMLSDVAITGLVSALRGIRKARAAKDSVGAETYADAARVLADDPDALAAAPAPQIRAARISDEPLVSRVVDEVGPEAAADALTLGRVPVGEGEVYINWSRIDTADDVKSVIQQMADVSKDEVDQARRGVRSNAETSLVAGKENAWQLLVDRRHGGAMNAEQTFAMRQLWAASGERLVQAANAVREAPSAENVFMFRRAVALHGTIQREVLAVRTETARALQQWKIPAGPNETVARQIGETVDMFGGEGVGNDLAQRIADLAERGEFDQLDNLTRKSALASTGDAVFEYWVNSILSGPKTHVVNAASNTAVIMLSQIERAAAAGVGVMRGTADPIRMREAGAMLHASIAAVPDAWSFARRAFASGESGFGMQKVEAPRTRAISTEALANTRSRSFNAVMNAPVISHGINAFGSIVSVPTRALGASDEFFKTISFRMEAHAQSARQAIREMGSDADPGALKARIAELAENPSEAVSLRAREFAAYNTFTNDAGRYAAILRDLRQKLPIARFVVPFINTPANILRFATERSPAAGLLGDVRADIAAGGKRADLALARMGLGSFVMLTSWDLAMNGQITGSGPSSIAERQALQRTGWQPYSVKIGDRYFAYNRLDPMGAQLGVAANMAEIARNVSQAPDDDDYLGAVYRTIGSVGQTMLDKSYVQGLSDLFSAMSDPKRYSEPYLERLAGSFVPAFVREIEGFVDPELRRASDTLERIKSVIPGLSESVPLRHDLWGREISYSSGLGPVYDAISPIYSKPIAAEPIDEEMRRIKYFAGMPSTSITEERLRYPLKNRPEIYERYVVLQGATPASSLPKKMTSRGDLTERSRRMVSYGDRTLLETLNAIVTGKHEVSADYADGEDADKEMIISRTISDFRAAAKSAVMQEYSDFFQPKNGIP